VYAVGVDLAWSPRNGTGLAVAERKTDRWFVREAISNLGTNREIVDILMKHVGDNPAIVAIDAPLVVPFEKRGREGDRLITKLFGPYDAGVYPATRFYLGRYGGKRIWDLVGQLERAGFRHDCVLEPEGSTRQFFETYPHAATTALFGLRRTLKYKTRPGRTYETRWREFRRLESHLRDLSRAEPAMAGIESSLSHDLRGLRGGKLKEYEDRLDGILCACIAAYYWTWGTRRCAIVGSLEGGYIVTPMTPAIAKRAPPGTRIFTYDGFESGGRESGAKSNQR
jgi:predicted RNase H-like nuclease